MLGIDKVREDMDGVRKRLARLDSLHYIDHDFCQHLQSHVLHVLGDVDEYIERLDLEVQEITA